MAVTLLLVFGNAAGSLAMATLFTAAAILALGVIVLARARATLVTYLFFLITVCAGGWLGCFALMYGSADDGRALAFAKVASAFASVLPAAVFHFAAAYVSRRRALRNVILFCWVFCGAIAVLELTTPYIVLGVRHFDWGYYPIGSSYNISWAVIFAGMFVLAIRMLWRSSKSSEGTARKRARSLVIAFTVAMLSSVEFLPSIGVDILPLGFIAILAFIAIATHAIWRYRLVELTPEYAAGQIWPR